MNAAEISRFAGLVAVEAKYTDAEIDVLLNAKSEADIPGKILLKIRTAYERKEARLNG